MSRYWCVALRTSAAGMVAGLIMLGLGPAAQGQVPSGMELQTRRTTHVPPEGTWGSPPADARNPYVEPVLPEFAGWSRYIPPAWYIQNLNLAGEVLIYATNDELHALDRVTGEELWKVSQDYDWGDHGVYANDQWYVCCQEDKTYVRAVLDGSLILELIDQLPIALTGNQLWTTLIRHWTEPTYGYDMVDVKLIELPSGAVLHTFSTGRLTATGEMDGSLGGGLPVRNEQDILLLKPDGAIKIFPLFNTKYVALLELIPAGLFCVECFNPLAAKRSEEEEAAIDADYEIYKQEWATLPQGPACVAKLLDPNSGEVRWEKQYTCSANVSDINAQYADGKLFLAEHTYSEDSGVDAVADAVQESADATALKGQLILNASDGSVACNSSTADEPVLNFSNYLATNNQAYFVIPDQWNDQLPYGVELSEAELASRLDQPRVVVLNCANSTTRSLSLPAECQLTLYAANTEVLLGLYTFADPNAAIDSRSQQIVAIELDQDGMPRAGKLRRLAYPALDLAPVDRFLAAVNPWADQALMTEMAKLGITGVARILEHLPELSPAQYDALVALCCYADQYAQGESHTRVAVAELIEESLKYPSELSTPVVLDWLRDPALERYRNELFGLLAACGGPKAKQVLDSEYSLYVYGARQAIPPPYNIQEPDIDSSLISFARTTDQAGQSYLAYTTSYWSRGLLSDRDIFLAVDGNADGTYEEVLFTGLRDSYIQYYHPGGYEGLSEPIRPLTIAVDGDVIQIKHHHPLFWPTIYFWEGMPRISQDLVTAEYISSTLSLAALRQDTDGDGLTDLLERELLTDPRNPDTDGDGKSDYVDLYPLTNQSQMGRLERGVMRALIYASQMRDSGYRPNADAQHPWQAEYVTLDGCGPVSWAPEPTVYGITLAGDWLSRKYNLMLGGEFPEGQSVHVMHLQAGAVAAEDTSSDYTPMFGGVNTDVIKTMPERLQYVLYIDYPGSGEAVILVDVEGELYPAQRVDTWIS